MRAEQLLEEAAARFGARTAVTSGAREYTYADLARIVDRAAAGLARHGVARGERVALMLADNFEAVVSIFAALKAGCIAVPLDGRAGADALAHLLRRSGASALITEVRLASVAAAALRTASQIRLVVLAGAERGALSGGCLTFEALAANMASAPAMPSMLPDSEPALFLPSSGADPEAVSHAQLLAAADEDEPPTAGRFSIFTRSGLARLLAVVHAGATLATVAAGVGCGDRGLALAS